MTRRELRAGSAAIPSDFRDGISTVASPTQVGHLPGSRRHMSMGMRVFALVVHGLRRLLTRGSVR